MGRCVKLNMEVLDFLLLLPVLLLLPLDQLPPLSPRPWLLLRLALLPPTLLLPMVPLGQRLIPSLWHPLRVFFDLVSYFFRHVDRGLLMIVPFAVKAQQGDTLEYIWGGGPVRLFTVLRKGLISSIPLLYQTELTYATSPLKQVHSILGNVSILSIL